MEDQKIIFSLEKDEDDYPPNDYETLWASFVENGLYSIDNIPFFVPGISCGDIVKVVEKEGGLFFDGLVRKSLNSVLRIIVYHEMDVGQLRNDLKDLGCESELSHVPNLIALEVPAGISLDSVLEFLDKGESDHNWEYETASLRQ